MEVFEFKEDILPTNGDVFRYINSRTAKRKLELGPTIHEAVTKIHHIWQKADACPMSVTCMIKRCHKLLKDRRDFVDKIHSETLASIPQNVPHQRRKDACLA